jgi:hypothetical protein
VSERTRRGGGGRREGGAGGGGTEAGSLRLRATTFPTVSRYGWPRSDGCSSCTGTDVRVGVMHT